MLADLGESKANAQVAGFLFNAAKNGNVTAQIFWLKTRARWRETPMELRHSGSIARKDLSEVSDEELLSIIYTIGSEYSQSSGHYPIAPQWARKGSWRELWKPPALPFYFSSRPARPT